MEKEMKLLDLLAKTAIFCVVGGFICMLLAVFSHLLTHKDEVVEQVKSPAKSIIDKKTQTGNKK